MEGENKRKKRRKGEHTSIPWVFTKLLKVAATFLRRSGIKLFIYFDDLLIVGTTAEECSDAVAQVIHVLESLGFLINFIDRTCCRKTTTLFWLQIQCIELPNTVTETL